MSTEDYGRQKNHWLDSIQEEPEVIKTEEVSKITNTPKVSKKADDEEEEEDDTEVQEGEEGNEDDSSEEGTEDTEEEEESNEFSYTPFVNHLIDSDVLVADPEKEYDDDENGFEELISDTIEAKLSSKIESYGNEVVGLFAHLENGGDLRSYLRELEGTPDYGNIDMDDEENQKGVIWEHLTKTGHSEEEAAELLQQYEEFNLLEKNSKIAQKYLIKDKEKQDESRIQTEREQLARKREEENSARENLYNTVMSIDEIAGFELSKKDRQNFYDYITKPVKKDKDGRLFTQNQLDDSAENRLKMAFMSFKKFEFKDVERKVQTKSALDLKKNLSRFEDKNMSIRNSDVQSQSKKTETKLPTLGWM